MSNLKKLTSGLLATFLIGILPQDAAAVSHYTVNPLVSNQLNVAPNTDPNLVNPWGLFFVSNGNFWVADNDSNLSTLYRPDGTIVPFVINVMTNPTGAALNPGTNFLIGTMPNMQPSRFVFASEAGTILGFNSAVDPANAVIAVDTSDLEAVYKGIDFAADSCGRMYLFATDFHNGRVAIFDSNFNYIKYSQDPGVLPGFAPFNVRSMNGYIYVTYAKQLPPDNRDDDPGVGNGYVDIFSPCGQFLSRLITQGNLNSPWGLAIAPSTFGDFSGALLVGNFGDGLIHAYNASTGAFLGQLTDTSGNPIQIDGLWALEFNSNGTLYFSSGPDGESNGLVGTITLAP